MHQLPSALVQDQPALLGSPDVAHGPRLKRKPQAKKCQYTQKFTFPVDVGKGRAVVGTGSLCHSKDVWFESNLGFAPKSEAGSDFLPTNTELGHGKSHRVVYSVFGREQK